VPARPFVQQNLGAGHQPVVVAATFQPHTRLSQAQPDAQLAFTGLNEYVVGIIRYGSLGHGFVPWLGLEPGECYQHLLGLPFYDTVKP
jgi:hypothetical protein